MVVEKKELNVVLVGIGGYGAHYAAALLARKADQVHLTAIVDPLARKSAAWPSVEHIPLYPDLQTFFASGRADLVIISSPIQFHEEQVVYALGQGAHVLCEKPLCATWGQGERILASVRQTGLHVGVGYQWSFNPVILQAKTDVLAGKFGWPTIFRTSVHWPRSRAYYQRNSWAGLKKDQQERPVFDSVINNATAHYLHNMLFFLGSALDQAAMPEQIDARLWRGQSIENYDTAFVRMQKQMPGQAPVELMMVASHSTDQVIDPSFEFCFSNGRLVHQAGQLTGYIGLDDKAADPQVVDYGTTHGGEDTEGKLNAMIAAARGGARPVCHVETAMPHVRVIDYLQKNCPIRDIPAELLQTKVDQDTSWTCMPALSRIMEQALASLTLPESFKINGDA